MNLAQIKAAIAAGQVVHWMNHGYTVTKDRNGNYLTAYHNGDCIGLTYTDGVTLNGQERQFFLREPDVQGLLCHISQNDKGAFRFDVSDMHKGFVTCVVCPDVVALRAYHADLVGYDPVDEDTEISEAEIVVMVAGSILFHNQKV